MKKKLIVISSIVASIFIVLLIISLSTKRNVNHDISEYILSYDIGEKEEFKILQLTDIHVANKDDRVRQYEFLDETIKLSNADMIVVTGDSFTFADKLTAKELFSFLDSYDIPWTITLGNHDEQCYFSIDWMTNYLNNYGSNCIFKDIQDDDIFGNANFVINLNKNNKLFEQLIIMDSNRYNYGEYVGYDYIKEDQIEWYSNLIDYTKKEMNNNENYDSLLFFHIPLPEWNEAWEKYENGDSSVKLIMGEKNEKFTPPLKNTGLFDKILEKGSTKAINVGHDHMNNFVLQYKGVYLCYGVNSTDRIYYQDHLIGGRVITIKADHTLEFSDVIHEYE